MKKRERNDSENRLGLDKRAELLGSLADMIVGIDLPHPIRVGIDGVDTSGKTTLAHELVKPVQDRRRAIIRASIDGFHRPREERYRRGKDSPEGYYYDSFDYDAVVSSLLSPLGPSGTRKYRTATFDFRTDSPVVPAWATASDNAILLFEGVFLFRPELVSYWDFKIFVDISFDTVHVRALIRDRDFLGSEEKVRERYEKRYIPGQKLYLNSVQPKNIANIVVDNNDFNAPLLIKSIES